jgi:hypothetical protein
MVGKRIWLKGNWTPGARQVWVRWEGTSTGPWFRIGIRFDPHDIWIGVYWKIDKPEFFGPWTYRIYICVLPMLPIWLAYTPKERL